jgi:cysteine-rich repeat protein
MIAAKRRQEMRVAWGLVLSGLLVASLNAGCRCGSGGSSTDAGGGGPDAGPDAARTDAATDSGGGGTFDGSPTDAVPTTDALPPATCGNAIVELPEECDDANTSADDYCLNDCTLACGDGLVNSVELCDTAIAAGSAGACPTSCDDGDACTTDALSGSDCTAECVHGAITAPAPGDGCCPPGENANTDTDCAPVCDNGVLEAGETCEPMASCPASCNDGDSCTSDTLTGAAATCDAACPFTIITACTAGDGCCPAGCIGVDADCSALCGNGALDPGETCDPVSSCPTSCFDVDPCTSDALSGNAMACSSSCPFTPVTMPFSGDMCCPPGANANNDGDCLPVCGNGIVEMGEGCDDGNVVSGDGCDATCQPEGPPPTTFRFTDLDLKDPHIYVDTGFPFGCQDVTNSVPLGLATPVNGQIQNAIQMDADGDGYLDLSFLLIFRPLDQTPGITGAMDLATGQCTAPMAGTSCDLQPMTMLNPTTFMNTASGTCLAAIPGTTTPRVGGYTPTITNTTGPCFVSGSIVIMLTIGGATITLQGSQVAATYVGVPAGSLSNGLERGFLSEADADAAIIDVPGFGMMPLSSLLPGGTGNCASFDDRDVGPDGTTMGWWFYLNFPATAVTYTGP